MPPCRCPCSWSRLDFPLRSATAAATASTILATLAPTRGASAFWIALVLAESVPLAPIIACLVSSATAGATLRTGAEAATGLAVGGVFGASLAAAVGDGALAGSLGVRLALLALIAAVVTVPTGIPIVSVKLAAVAAGSVVYATTRIDARGVFVATCLLVGAGLVGAGVAALCGALCGARATSRVRTAAVRSAAAHAGIAATLTQALQGRHGHATTHGDDDDASGAAFVHTRLARAHFLQAVADAETAAGASAAPDAAWEKRLQCCSGRGGGEPSPPHNAPALPAALRGLASACASIAAYDGDRAAAARRGAASSRSLLGAPESSTALSWAKLVAPHIASRGAFISACLKRPGEVGGGDAPEKESAPPAVDGGSAELDNAVLTWRQGAYYGTQGAGDEAEAQGYAPAMARYAALYCLSAACDAVRPPANADSPPATRASTPPTTSCCGGDGQGGSCGRRAAVFLRLTGFFKSKRPFFVVKTMIAVVAAAAAAGVIAPASGALGGLWGANAVFMVGLRDASGGSGRSLRLGLQRLMGTAAGFAAGMTCLAFAGAVAPRTEPAPGVVPVHDIIVLSLLACWVALATVARSSDYAYAALVASFTPYTFVLADAGGDVAAARLAQTAIGLAVYTAVEALCWPVSANDGVLPAANNTLQLAAGMLADVSIALSDAGDHPALAGGGSRVHAAALSAAIAHVRALAAEASLEPAWFAAAAAKAPAPTEQQDEDDDAPLITLPGGALAALLDALDSVNASLSLAASAVGLGGGLQVPTPGRPCWLAAAAPPCTCTRTRSSRSAAPYPSPSPRLVERAELTQPWRGKRVLGARLSRRPPCLKQRTLKMCTSAAWTARPCCPTRRWCRCTPRCLG